MPNMRKTITVKFNFGDNVLLKTERSVGRIVTGIITRPGGQMYELASGLESSWHHDVEIENEPVKKTAGFNNKH